MRRISMWNLRQRRYRQSETGRRAESHSETKGVEDINRCYGHAPNHPEGGKGTPMDKQQTAIVTGASGGIGAHLVTALRGRGCRVVANSRNISSTHSFESLSDCHRRDARRRVPVSGLPDRIWHSKPI